MNYWQQRPDGEPKGETRGATVSLEATKIERPTHRWTELASLESHWSLGYTSFILEDHVETVEVFQTCSYRIAFCFSDPVIIIKYAQHSDLGNVCKIGVELFQLFSFCCSVVSRALCVLYTEERTNICFFVKYECELLGMCPCRLWL